ncbi:MAG: ADP-ribosylglycohydrolase family protein [Candidatus Eisenbacteria bacterium]
MNARPFPVSDPSLDAATGALLGACVGDAAGAPLEFLGRAPSEAEVERACAMPGGGPLGLAPGQITDDGELTLCLARALATSERFELERIARSYADWIASAPFDLGETTRLSLGATREEVWREASVSRGLAAVMTKAAAERCMASKANGSLMRATPLGVFGRCLADEGVAAIAMADSNLSHPNPTCGQAVACYSLAIAELVRSPGSRERAFLRAEAWAAREAGDEVRGWLEEARQGRPVPYYPMAGFVRIGFTHAFRHLLRGSSYEEAIVETLKGGGDTDTNACIVGGLIGAAVGASAIPRAMAEAVLSCETRRGRPRPDFLSSRQLFDLALRLWQNAPSESAGTAPAG